MALQPSGGGGFGRASVSGGDGGPSSSSSDYSELLISKLLAMKVRWTLGGVFI